MPKTIILLPTYNERENVLRIIPEIFQTDARLGILVIDDNSPDGTAEVIRSLMTQYPNLRLLSRPEKEGLGEAYKAGIAQVLADSSIERIITMDADGSHAVEYLPALISASETYDMVIGSRYVLGGGIENWERWRYALSQGGNWYTRTIIGLPIKDITAGFVCYRTDILRRVDFSRVKASGYAFQMELKFCIAYTLGGSVAEIPIVFRARREGESKISRHIITEGLKTPWRLFYRKWINYEH